MARQGKAARTENKEEKDFGALYNYVINMIFSITNFENHQNQIWHATPSPCRLRLRLRFRLRLVMRKNILQQTIHHPRVAPIVSADLFCIDRRYTIDIDKDTTSKTEY